MLGVAIALVAHTKLPLSLSHPLVLGEGGGGCNGAGAGGDVTVSALHRVTKVSLLHFRTTTTGAGRLLRCCR